MSIYIKSKFIFFALLIIVIAAFILMIYSDSEFIFAVLFGLSGMFPQIGFKHKKSTAGGHDEN